MKTSDKKFEVSKTEQEWKAILTPEQFNVLPLFSKIGPI